MAEISKNETRKTLILRCTWNAPIGQPAD